MTHTARLRREIEHAAAALAEAGVGSPRADAEELAAYAAGTSRGRLSVLDESTTTSAAATPIWSPLARGGSRCSTSSVPPRSVR